MKKAFTFVLAVALVMAMAVPAYAVVSPTAPVYNQNTTAPVPEMVGFEAEGGENASLIVDLVPVEEAPILSEEAQEVYATAQEALEEACPNGMNVLYFCYVTIQQEGEMEKVNSVSLTLRIEGITQIVVKQFIDGKWVELESIINGDGTVTIKGVQEGPIAIFTR